MYTHISYAYIHPYHQQILLAYIHRHHTLMYMCAYDTQLTVLGEVTEDDPYINPIDEDYEAGMIRDLNDKCDNQVNPFQ